MTIKESIVKAVLENDGITAGKIVDVLRFKYGKNYNECFETFNEALKQEKVSIDLSKFDALMYEADYYNQY